MSAELEAENADLLQFLYACPIGLAEVGPDGTLGMMNPLAMQLLLPIARTPVITNLFAIMEAYAPELRNLVEAFTAPQGTVCRDHRIFISASSKQTNRQPQVLACTLVKLNSQRFMATFADISVQVTQERRLKHAETWFATLLDGINDFAVISLDAEGYVDAVNPSALRQTGFEATEMIGRPLAVFDVPEPGRMILSMPEQIAIAQRDGWHLDEGWRERRSGERYWCQTLISVRSEAEGTEGHTISGYTVVLRDVTRQEFDTAQLKRMLTTDHLTGARNRAHFFEVAERERSRAHRFGQPLSLIALDVDHFKRVNDTYGHGAGDQVLRDLSSICATVLRPSDTFSRLGGEEFVILMPMIDLSEAVVVAERIRAAISAAAIEVDGQTLHVTASFGCAALSAQTTTVAVMLATADAALYEAKRSGRDRVVSGPVRAVA